MDFFTVAYFIVAGIGLVYSIVALKAFTDTYDQSPLLLGPLIVQSVFVLAALLTIGQSWWAILWIALAIISYIYAVPACAAKAESIAGENTATVQRAARAQALLPLGVAGVAVILIAFLSEKAKIGQVAYG